LIFVPNNRLHGNTDSVAGRHTRCSLKLVGNKQEKLFGTRNDEGFEARTIQISMN